MGGSAFEQLAGGFSPCDDGLVAEHKMQVHYTF